MRLHQTEHIGFYRPNTDLVIQEDNVSGRPALVRSRDVKAVIRAARKSGLKQVIVNVDRASIVIPLCPHDKPVEAEPAAGANEWAIDDAHQA